ncbi:MAG: glycosyltransferase family 61 protein [Rhodospirillales bacterium]|nr:glycosyltransferase family 61 protein [Rhodospirillales bacterium]
MSAAPPTVELAALAPPAEMTTALRRWSGFVPVLPASLRPAGMPYLRLCPDAAGEWLRHDNPAVAIPPLGCAFLHDVTLHGSGYPFQDGRYIREPAHTSQAGLAWLEDPAFHDHPLTRQPRRTIRLEEPALLIFGPGFGIYGHWLLDFLPRLAIARMTLGRRLDAFVLPLPDDAPAWVGRMLSEFAGIEATRLRPYRRTEEQVFCPRLCLPSFAHHGDYAPHALMRQFYAAYRPDIPTGGERRLCLSRHGLDGGGFSHPRIFEQRAAMEAIAAARGFEIVAPESLPFAEQVALFRGARIVAGEYGSGMHNTIFSAPGTVVGMVGWWSHIQTHLLAACGQSGLFMSRITEQQGHDGSPYRFSAAVDDLEALFDRVEAAAEAPTPGDPGLAAEAAWG